MREIETAVGQGILRITIQGYTTDGNGLCLFMSGGEKPHNGGTVVAVPRLKSNAKDAEDRTADIWVSSVPGHKDTEIGMPAAKKLAVALNEAVSLTAGIHVDHASAQEIEMLCQNSLTAAEQWIAEYRAEEKETR
jgi:hypothetical protein